MTPTQEHASEHFHNTSSLNADQLYLEHHIHIFRFIWSRLHDPQEAEDLTGEVFYRMVAHLPDYRDRSLPFRAWLYRIARNLVIDHHRKERPAPVSIESAAVHTDIPSPEEEVQTVLTLERIQRVLANLDPQQREVVELRFLAGLSLEEVALTLGKSVAAVKALQHRGLMAIRVHLKA